MNLVEGNELTRVNSVIYSVNDLMWRICCEVAMKKNRGFISAFVLVAMAGVSCAKSPDKKEAYVSASAGPELRWKYETGG